MGLFKEALSLLISCILKLLSYTFFGGILLLYIFALLIVICLAVYGHYFLTSIYRSAYESDCVRQARALVDEFKFTSRKFVLSVQGNPGVVYDFRGFVYSQLDFFRDYLDYCSSYRVSRKELVEQLDSLNPMFKFTFYRIESKLIDSLKLSVESYPHVCVKVLDANLHLVKEYFYRYEDIKCLNIV